MRNQRLTRRAILLSSAAVLTLAATGLRAPVLAQTPPGVLILGQVAEPKTLDPQAATAANDFRISVNVFDGLVRFKDGTLEVEPALAEIRQHLPDRGGMLETVSGAAGCDDNALR